MAQILPFTSLASAAAVGAGVPVDLNGTSNEFSLVAFTSGTPTGFGVDLEGSHDGVNWFYLGLTVASPGSPISSEYTNTNDNGGGQPATRVKPHARYLRANLTSLAGGTSPTVTATIAVGTVV